MSRVDYRRVKSIANLLKGMPEGKGLNFYSFKGDTEQDPVSASMYPAKDHPLAPDFFFLVCMHQYGFWVGNDRTYEQPLFGTFDGRKTKGSDALWKSVKRAFDSDPSIVMPERLATIKYDDFVGKLFADDKGPMAYPDFEHRFRLTRAYGSQMMDAETSPEKILDIANGDKQPLGRFLDITSGINGYADDPLLKKNRLLAMALANRPEKFLDVKDQENEEPIVDYHLMRMALRMGLVKPSPANGLSADLHELKERKFVDEKAEADIRHATYRAVQRLIKESGKPLGFVDVKLWMGRKYCPEMEAPNCGECLFAKKCAKHTDLFQPVFRTDAY